MTVGHATQSGGRSEGRVALELMVAFRVSLTQPSFTRTSSDSAPPRSPAHGLQRDAAALVVLAVMVGKQVDLELIEEDRVHSRILHRGEPRAERVGPPEQRDAALVPPTPRSSRHPESGGQR